MDIPAIGTKFTIPVTQKHIGSPGDWCRVLDPETKQAENVGSCMVDRAVADFFGVPDDSRHVGTGFYNSTVYLDPGSPEKAGDWSQSFTLHLDRETAKRIAAWDQGKTVKPFEFEATVESTGLDAV